MHSMHYVCIMDAGWISWVMLEEDGIEVCSYWCQNDVKLLHTNTATVTEHVMYMWRWLCICCLSIVVWVQSVIKTTVQRAKAALVYIKWMPDNMNISADHAITRTGDCTVNVLHHVKVFTSESVTQVQSACGQMAAVIRLRRSHGRHETMCWESI